MKVLQEVFYETDAAGFAALLLEARSAAQRAQRRITRFLGTHSLREKLLTLRLKMELDLVLQVLFAC